ncbi:hypothetical protein SAMN05444724_2795 [Salinivibrio sp. ES.052]|nr:hypothetical protein SAMN05444724_2795 [Salinivibrio sp. ES.052]
MSGVLPLSLYPLQIQHKHVVDDAIGATNMNIKKMDIKKLGHRPELFIISPTRVCDLGFF